MRLFFFLFFTTFSCIFRTQTSGELLAKLKTANSDTAKLNRLNELTEYYVSQNKDSAKYFNLQSLNFSDQKKINQYNYDGYHYEALLKKLDKNYDEALTLISKAKELAKRTNNLLNEVRAMRLTGGIYELQDKNKEALNTYFDALKLSASAHDKKALVIANIALGIYYKKNDQTSSALTYLLNGLKLAEEIPDSNSIFTCVINLGTLYEITNDRAKALDFYKKALIINKIDKDENGTAICSFKIGKLYYTMHQPDSAKLYLDQSLRIHEKRKDEIGLIYDYSYLATFYMNQGNLSMAEKSLLKSVDLAVKNNDSIRINLMYSSLAALHMKQNNFKNSVHDLELALRYRGHGVPKETMAQIYSKLAESHEKLKHYKQAYDNYIIYKFWSDSSSNVNETKKQTELKLNYEFNQVQEKIEAEAKAKELISKAELEKEHLLRNFSLMGLALISLFLVLAIRSYRMKRKANFILDKQKKEIQHQKNLVDIKNNEIKDSINYSLRIQRASLPENKEMEKYFPGHILFFRPKDIVSGDFYWAAEYKNKALIAIGDCTGHGVPGAITSMIGSILLNEIFYVKNIYSPDEVLGELNRLVKITLRQESDSLSKDGMDIAFCKWDKETNELFFAGANRPLYILKSTRQVVEYKPTKASIGGYVPLDQRYNLNKIILEQGDTVVLTSDGYTDQFGGKNEKKFTTRAFKKLLSEITELSPGEKKLAIENTFSNWKNNFEQTDDVLVFMINT